MNFIPLYNIGSTCYINSVIQVFFNMELLNNKLLEIDVSSDRLLQVYKLLYKQGNLLVNKKISPDDYYKINFLLTNELLKICSFKNEQNDAHEFLIKVLDTITTKEIKKFYSFYFDKIGKCDNCEKEIRYIHTIDNWFGLENIKDEFYGISKRECQNCKKDIIIKNSSISIPNYIIVYNMGNNIRMNFEINDKLYKMYFAICHIGNSASGHYFSIINKNNIYYKLDDTSFSIINTNFLKNVNITTIIYKKINSNNS